MTDKTQSPIVIDYYTDVLCVWAWISQPRLEEVHRQWMARVEVRHRYFDIFGDSHKKIANQWGQESGFEKFSLHVRDVRRAIRRNKHPSGYLVKSQAQIIPAGAPVIESRRACCRARRCRKTGTAHPQRIL